jgi:Spy/CpxP family protein refolding chaperone
MKEAQNSWTAGHSGENKVMKAFRILKNAVATAGLLAMIATPAALLAQDTSQSNPQDQAASTQPGHRHGDELAKLNLTDEQKAQVKKIHENMRAQMDAVKNDTTLTAEQKQAKMKELHKSSHEQVKQLLTPEQRQQLKADEKERKAEKQQSGQTAAPQQ